MKNIIHFFQENSREPLLFNESHHALETMPLHQQEPTTLDSLEHDELLQHLQIRKNVSHSYFICINENQCNPYIKQCTKIKAQSNRLAPFSFAMR